MPAFAAVTVSGEGEAVVTIPGPAFRVVARANTSVLPSSTIPAKIQQHHRFPIPQKPRLAMARS